jgi:hypothetical protein
MTDRTADPTPLLRGEALLDRADNVWLPYDLAHLCKPPDGWARLSSRRVARHRQQQPFQWDSPANDELHILSGMGVTLGDSVIGMNAIAWLKERHPALRVHLYRTPHAPRFVERLYELARPLVEPVHYLPRPLQSLPAELVDLSDFMHWPVFATEPMVDFFLRGLGVAPDAVPASEKRNRWLSRLELPPLPAPWAVQDYALFSGHASTPLRTVPVACAWKMVDRIHRAYALPVLGFGAVTHPHYHDIATLSPGLDHYVAWVRGARVVIGSDSSAIHLAAGFDVPTLAFFVSIEPRLRVRDYSHCCAVDARSELTHGLHQSDNPAVLREAGRIWRAIVERTDLPWPVSRPAEHGRNVSLRRDTQLHHAA